MTGLSGRLKAVGVTHRADITGRDLSRLEAAYRLHVGRVYTLCLRLLADAGSAEEATARVFARLGRELPYRPDGDRIRDLSIREALACLDTPGREMDATGAAPTRAAVAPSQTSLDAAAARLPAGLRAAFVLHDVEGLSAAAVAGHLRVEESEARRLVREARVELRGLYFGRETG